MIDLCDDVRFEAFIPGLNKFILDVSQLDVDMLGEADYNDNYEWVDFTAKAINFTIDRGADLYNNNGFARADASTLTVRSLEQDYDPQDRDAVFPGMPVRVTVDVDGTWERLYTGKMQSINTEYSTEGSPITTLIAQDDVERLSNFSVWRGDPETVDMRLRHIAAVTGTTINVSGTSDTLLAPKETPGSAWDVVELAITSEGGFIFPTANGELNAWMRGYRDNTTAIDFSDKCDDTNDNWHSYSGINVEKSAERVVNVVKIINIATAGLDGQDKEVTLELWKNQGSIDVYGPKELELRTNVVSLNDAGELAQFVLEAFSTPETGVQSLEFRPKSTKFTTLDVGDNVTVEFSNVLNNNFMVSSVSHDVDTDGWRTTVGLFKRNDVAKTWL